MSIPVTRMTLAVAASLVMVAGPAASAAPASSWTTARVATGSFLNVSMAVDSAGVTHLAVDGAAGITYLDDRGGMWHRKLVLANGDGAPPSVADSGHDHDSWGMPSLALDDHDRVYIAAVYGALDAVPGASSGIWLVTDMGHPRGTFGKPRKLAGKRATEPSLKVVGGHLALAYGSYGQMGPGHQPVWFGTDASGTWTRSQVALDGSAPALRMDGDGHARIAFDGRDVIRYARATTRTGGFVVSTVTGTKGRVGAPSLALDAAGRPHIAWSDSGHAWYSAWSGSSWAAPVAVDVGSYVFRMELSLDAGGRPHLAIATEDVIHASRDASGWHHETIAAGANPLEVAIRASASGLVVAWTGGGAWVGRR